MNLKLVREEPQEDCPLNDLMAIKDALQVLNGTWKLPIIIALLDGNKRFNEISKVVTGISDRMLSRELKDLELNQLIKRTIFDTFPPTIEYSTTEHTKTLYNVIIALRDWGKIHRNAITENF